jgi:hypothetical protein
MKHYASPSFWKCYDNLPESIKELADKNYQLLKQNSTHPSLHFKKIQNYFSVRVGLKYRALGIEVDHGVLWFWIGDHTNYDKLLANS